MFLAPASSPSRFAAEEYCLIRFSRCVCVSGPLHQQIVQRNLVTPKRVYAQTRLALHRLQREAPFRGFPPMKHQAFSRTSSESQRIEMDCNVTCPPVFSQGASTTKTVNQWITSTAAKKNRHAGKN